MKTFIMGCLVAFITGGIIFMMTAKAEWNFIISEDTEKRLSAYAELIRK